MADLQWNKNFALEQSGQDSELLEELLNLLVDSSESDLNRIREGIAAGDYHAVAAAAHSIKGAAASIGVDGLREAAHDIEKESRAGGINNHDVALLENLVSQLKKLKA